MYLFIHDLNCLGGGCWDARRSALLLFCCLFYVASVMCVRVCAALQIKNVVLFLPVVFL